MSERYRSLLSYDECVKLCSEARREADAVGGEALARYVNGKKEEPVYATNALSQEELSLCASLGLVRRLRRVGNGWEYDITTLGIVLMKNQDDCAAANAMRRLTTGDA